jgi:hypothetical protein
LPLIISSIPKSQKKPASDRLKPAHRLKPAQRPAKAGPSPASQRHRSAPPHPRLVSQLAPRPAPPPPAQLTPPPNGRKPPTTARQPPATLLLKQAPVPLCPRPTRSTRVVARTSTPPIQRSSELVSKKREKRRVASCANLVASFLRNQATVSLALASHRANSLR